MAKKRVYQWTLPLRLLHWVRFAALAVLVFTGFYVHSPFLAGGTGTMAWNRFFHMVFGYVLLFGFIMRTYLMFFSRVGADWDELLPLRRNLVKIPAVLRYYLFLSDGHDYQYKRYNPLQGPVYFVTGLLIAFMAVTGLALHKGWLSGWFAWVLTLFGGEPNTRIAHFLGMWLVIIMSATHIYVAVRENFVKHDRSLLSMVDGWMDKETAE